MRKLLANASTTPSSGGAGDLLLPLLSNFPSGWLPLSATADRDPPRSKQTRSRGKASTTRRWGRTRATARGARKREGVRGCARDTVGVARALKAVAGAALQASKEYQEALLGGAANHGGSGGGGGGSGGDRVGNGPNRSNPALGATECGGTVPTFQRWGAVGVLNISVASSQVDFALGGWKAGRTLLSGEAWAWLEAFFRTPEIGWQVRKVFRAKAVGCGVLHCFLHMHVMPSTGANVLPPETAAVLEAPNKIETTHLHYQCLSFEVPFFNPGTIGAPANPSLTQSSNRRGPV